MKDISFELSDDERGVSPVIGVILMVAITVILAAVIASFVLGFGGSVQSNASAGVSVAENSTGGSGYNVTVVSLGDNTDGIKCAEGTNAFATNVGETLTNCQGSVVAYSNGSASNATIRTLG